MAEDPAFWNRVGFFAKIHELIGKDPENIDLSWMRAHFNQLKKETEDEEKEQRKRDL